MRIGDLVPRREERPERREGIGALALEALPAAIELEIALGKIDADAIAEHVVERLTLGDIDTRLADHHAELDLPVDALRLARHDEIVGGSAQRAGRLQEKRRLFRQRQASFLSMITVVQADADDLSDTSQGRAQNGILRRFRQRLCWYRGNRFDIGKRRRAGIERRKTAGQVEDLAVQNETGLLAGCRTITDELHGLYNIRGSCKTASRSIVPQGSPRMNFPKPAVGMLPNDRLDYSPITERKPLKLPKGARMVVWTITNVEEWDPTQTMPRTVLTPPAGGSPMPDIPNWCWHEYGNRVGFWRLLQVYDDFKIPGVMNINGVAVKAYPDIVKACVDRNWEFIGHGYTQRNMQKVENERADIRKSAEVLEEATGKRPRGWLGPGLTETWETPDILAEEGYDYVADWVLDDQPVWMKTRGKPILNIPYTQECNDVAMMLIQHHKASEFYERAMDQFEQIYKDAKGSARVMAISVHPYIMGAPHRAKYFRKIYEKIRKKRDVLFWTGSQIADWYKKVGPKPA